MSVEQEHDVAAPADAEIEALQSQAAQLQARVDGYASRLADMEQLIQQFQLQQYRAMGPIVEKCLSLRRDYSRLMVFHSGRAEDLEAARRADAEWDDYRRGRGDQSVEATVDEARASLDPAEGDELKKLYRTAAMRCHPDRVSDEEKDSAHDFFLRAQRAYQEGDVDALRLINAQLAGRMNVDLCTAADRASLKFLIARFHTQGADLLLAIQTLQLDNVYRKAMRKDEWNASFARAREQLEAECAALTEWIRACSAN